MAHGITQAPGSASKSPAATWAGAAISALLALDGCSRPVARGGGYCAPPSAPSFSLAPDRPPPDGAPREARLAALLGLGGASADAAGPGSRDRVVERVQLASLSIEATAAELDCERERAGQAADYLIRGQTETAQALTIASILAAGLTGITGVLLSTAGRPAIEQDTVAISGGVVTAGLGLGSLFAHPHATFEHPRNLLVDVWLGPATSSTYPPVVWTYLTRPEFSNSGRLAIRENIVARWRQFRQVDDPSIAALLFGSGGSYDADALRLRAALLGEVKAEVELAHQELQNLAVTLLRRDSRGGGEITR